MFWQPLPIDNTWIFVEIPSCDYSLLSYKGPYQYLFMYGTSVLHVFYTYTILYVSI